MGGRRIALTSKGNNVICNALQYSLVGVYKYSMTLDHVAGRIAIGAATVSHVLAANSATGLTRDYTGSCRGTV